MVISFLFTADGLAVSPFELHLRISIAWFPDSLFRNRCLGVSPIMMSSLLKKSYPSMHFCLLPRSARRNVHSYVIVLPWMSKRVISRTTSPCIAFSVVALGVTIFRFTTFIFMFLCPFILLYSLMSRIESDAPQSFSIFTCILSLGLPISALR